MQPPDLKNLALPGPVGMIAAIALAAGACDQSEMPSSVPPSETEVRTAVSQMVDDFLNLRMVQPFPAPLSLDEAYRWQNEFVGLLRPTMGEVVGYKTGGHNPGPVNPAFPPDGIRAQMLSGMFLEDGAAIRLDDVTEAGFLEADFALRVGSRAINEAETDLEILAGLDAVVPFAEVPDPYGAPDDNAMIRGVVSNMSTRIALAGDPVPVEPTEEWLQRIDSMEFAVLDENDRVIQSGSMAEWYQPIAVVRWLRDHLKMYGKELIPGQILSLGNIGIIRPLYDGTPRGEAYASNQFRIEYYGLKDDGPATVTINIDRSNREMAYSEVSGWIQPPNARSLGAVSSVYPDGEGNLWIAERCGQNSCADRDTLAPIHLYDSSGRWIRGFGQGMFVWPHGIYVDSDGNIWVTDGDGDGQRGHQVFKFSPEGDVLMTLGQAGVPGSGPGQFNGPTGVVVAPNGDIFVTDGHDPDSNNRVQKFSADGQFLASFGGTGSGPGQFIVPHEIAMDSGGRLFVADRDNNRIQILDQDGVFLDQWHQFGRASGLFISADDNLYVSDNQSNTDRNPGWERGIRVGSASDGTVDAFIPDPAFDPTNTAATGAHGLAANASGEVFGAEVGATIVRKYERR